MPDPKELAFRGVIGRSRALRDAIDLASKLGESRIQNVLIEGETGTGKELFARGIHYTSDGADQPFAAVNCAAIPPALLESELFGHERGAYTDAHKQKKGLLELAGRGTLLLDEINELPLGLQPKLLRVLEERTIRRLGGLEELEIHCRIAAATNVALEDAVRRKEFRADLYYRLNVFRVALPPLRDRGDDVVLLAEHFLREIAEERFEAPKSLSPEALGVLRIHAWPGNVRELKNVIQRAYVLSPGDEIRPDHLVVQRRTEARVSALQAGERENGAPAPDPPDGSLHLVLPRGGSTLAEVEREAILRTLEQTDGNQSEAARRLDISRPRLARKLDRYGLRELLGL